jgi:hypothetical protein
VGVVLGAALGLFVGDAQAARPAPKKPAKTAVARPKSPPVDPAVQAAEAQYAAAMRAFEAGDRARARDLFVAALGALPTGHALQAQTLYNLAFLADGDVAGGPVGASCDAHAAYGRYLETAPASLEHAETRAVAQERQAALLAQCERDRSPELAATPEVGADFEPGSGLPPRTEPGGAGAPLALGLGAVALAGAGVGLQFWAQAAIDTRDAAHADYLRVSDAGAAHRQAQIARNAQTDAESRVIYSYVAFGLAGALAGVAGWLWLSSPGTPEGEAAVTVAPGVGGGSMVLEGRF